MDLLTNFADPTSNSEPLRFMTQRFLKTYLLVVKAITVLSGPFPKNYYCEVSLAVVHHLILMKYSDVRPIVTDIQ